jgi:hypothetical protein
MEEEIERTSEFRLSNTKIYEFLKNVWKNLLKYRRYFIRTFSAH